MLEIERKFLVDTSKWSPKGSGDRIIQGYLSTDKERVVRVRVRNDKAFLTVKGGQKGISRPEFEYAIPVADAMAMLELCEAFPVEKTRYLEPFEGMLWEIDVFEGANQGLVMAEVELSSENQEIIPPEWAGEEVSSDYRYFNAWLTNHPFKKW